MFAEAAGLFVTPSSLTIDKDELRTGSISVKVYYLVMGAIYPLVTGFALELRSALWSLLFAD